MGGVDPQEEGLNRSAGGVTSAGGPGVNTAGQVQPPQPALANSPEVQDLYQQLSTLSAGTKQVQIRNPLKDPSDND